MTGVEKQRPDLLCLYEEKPTEEDILHLHHPTDHAKYRTIGAEELSAIEPLLVDIMKEGRQISETPSIDELRQTRSFDEVRLDSGVKRLINPHVYHVSLSSRMWKMKQGLIDGARKSMDGEH